MNIEFEPEQLGTPFFLIASGCKINDVNIIDDINFKGIGSDTEKIKVLVETIKILAETTDEKIDYKNILNE